MNETELVDRARSGDKGCFEELVRLYGAKMYNYCLRMTGNTQDAADVVQEVFIRAYLNLGGFRGESSFSTWMHRIAYNMCMDFLREKRRRGILSLFWPGSDEEAEEPEAQIVSDDPGPQEQAERSEAVRLLDLGLRKLSPDHRSIIILRDINGLSYEEIAQALSISMGTVKSRLARARESLKRILLEQGNFFESYQSNEVERRGSL